ncbi:hypothetical protein EJB05_25910 [Eragrostis curvula]|uniref:Uncharacterized protein n=1 Tax=Eragrostis curvula TaxID=38414 RepID=A0A5J9UJH0_9POAL|nr:hypothetical protein EJB05_25909 [Eragrostis curvula]TVU23536.1 hypothetical protein EJB05_25910 [Eragrostis curvula]
MDKKMQETTDLLICPLALQRTMYLKDGTSPTRLPRRENDDSSGHSPGLPASGPYGELNSFCGRVPYAGPLFSATTCAGRRKEALTTQSCCSALERTSCRSPSFFSVVCP